MLLLNINLLSHFFFKDSPNLASVFSAFFFCRFSHFNYSNFCIGFVTFLIFELIFCYLISCFLSIFTI